MRRLLLAALLLLAAPLLGAEIRQITPAAGHGLAVLQAPESRGTWRVVESDSLAEVAPQIVADASLAILEAVPGTYLVRWRSGPLARWQSATVVLGGTPRPDDEPIPPGPVPEPLPGPVATAIVVLIEETAEPPDDVDIAAIRLSGVSGEIAKVCKAAGISWKCVDVDVVGPDGKQPKQLVPFLEQAKGKTLPWIIGTSRTDDSGTAEIVFSRRCPPTVDEVLKLLKGKAN